MKASPLHELQPRECGAGQGHPPVRIGFNLANKRRPSLSVPEHEEAGSLSVLILRRG